MRNYEYQNVGKVTSGCLFRIGDQNLKKYDSGRCPSSFPPPPHSAVTLSDTTQATNPERMNTRK